MATSTDFMFDNTLMPVTTQQYTLMRGVTDYTQLAQFDLYEQGYSFLVMLKIPTFLDVMRSMDTRYQSLIDNYSHIIEYDFRGAQGIEDITSSQNNITNGIDQLQIITQVTEQGSSGFSMNYFERSGSVITKTHEAYLRGIKDPRTQIKRYNGILKQRFDANNNGSGDTAIYNKGKENLMNDKGYQYEVFHFLLIITDNTGLNLEKAYILASAQPTTANTSIYQVTKGEYNFSEISVTYNAFPITGKIVNYKAVHFLDWINEHTCFNEMDYAYNILSDPKLQVDGEQLNNLPYTESTVIENTTGVPKAKTTRVNAAYTTPAARVETERNTSLING